MEINKHSIIVGCNYHTTWQKHRAMRFVLVEVKDNKARLQTRETKKDFWTNINDLIFIMSDYNIKKAKSLSINDYKKTTKETY